MRLGLGLSVPGVAARRLPALPISTQDFTFGQIGSGFTHFRDDTSHPQYLYTSPSLHIFGTPSTGSYWSGIVTGTDAEMRVVLSNDGSDQADATTVDVSVDDGPWTICPRIGATPWFTLFSGLSQGPHKVVTRSDRGPGYPFVLYPKQGPLIRVTGQGPGIVSAAGWKQPGEAGSVTAAGLADSGKAGYTPVKVPGQSAGSAVNAAAIAVRGTFSEVWVSAITQYLYLSIDGAAPTRYAVQPYGGSVRIPKLSGEHTYYAWCGGGGVMLSFGYVGTVSGAQPTRRMNAIGDSVLEAAPVDRGQGVPNTSSYGEGDIYRVAAALGYVGANHGIGGQTTEVIEGRMDALLATLTVTADDVFICAAGRNDGGMADPSPANRQEKYASIIAKALAKGFGKVLMRGIIPETSPGLPSNAPMQAAVTAANDLRVRYVDTSGWATISRPDGVHPNDAGYAQVAAYAQPAYQAALA